MNILPNCNSNCEPEMNTISISDDLAQAYVPSQVATKIFESETALCVGTVFPELVRPYIKGMTFKLFKGVD